MPAKIFGPRKRRTRQHVIANQAVHYVEGLILDEGHTAERTFFDYGYDLELRTYDVHGYIEPGAVYFQIKASEHLVEVDGTVVYDLDIRDYNLWMLEQLPVILVLYDAIRRNAYWQNVQQYFLADELRQPKKGTKWVRVHLPMGQEINRRAVVEFRRLKAKIIDIDGVERD